MKIILFTGSRIWNNPRPVIQKIQSLVTEYKDVTFIHGYADGLDRIVHIYCKAHNILVRGYKAKWKQYGISAGPIRNQYMIDNQKAIEQPIDVCYAYPVENSIGTIDMINRAISAHIPTFVFHRNMYIRIDVLMSLEQSLKDNAYIWSILAQQ